MSNRKKTIQYAFQKSIPIMTGYIVLGMGFGILLQKQGLKLSVAVLQKKWEAVRLQSTVLHLVLLQQK